MFLVRVFLETLLKTPPLYVFSFNEYILHRDLRLNKMPFWFSYHSHEYCWRQMIRTGFCSIFLQLSNARIFANVGVLWVQSRPFFKQKMKITRKLLEIFFYSVQQNCAFQTWEQICRTFGTCEKSWKKVIMKKKRFF